MLIWTASTRSAIEENANLLKQNHKNVVEFMNDQVNKCSSDENLLTAWGEKCGDVWSSQKIVKFILNSLNLNNPYSITDDLIQKGIIFVSSADFLSEAGSEWIVGTCIKSPCVAAGNNELISIYR